ncbi:hypothetical protein [Soonwooa purpurea]
MKTMTKLGLAVILFIATAVFNSAMAQKYGGSAYVQVKNKEGETMVLNAVTGCNYSSEAAAKESLRQDLYRYLAGNQSFAGAIIYDINWCHNNDNSKYGGSASVKAKTNSGETRTLNVNVDCKYDTKAEAKKELEQEFFRHTAGNEKRVSRYIFDIDSCN